MVRSMAGQGSLITRKPPLPSITEFPSLSTTSISTPGSGTEAEPGFVEMIPGRALIMIIPVSVCHQVSTIGHRSDPMCLWYQIQASGLIGSPTVPKRRRLERSRRAGHSSPHFIKARMAVGAV